MVKAIKQSKRGTSPMYAFISPLNDDFIRLGSAAALVARARQTCTADDIIDLFKCALFLDDFDPMPDKSHSMRFDPTNCIVSVLHSTDALPGDYAHWDTLLFRSSSPEDAFKALATIPYRNFPERGQRELEAMFAPKIKLVTWSRQHGQAMPALLAQMATSRRSH
jgi:hypothetical protein